jgi:hypothetical protein
MSKDRADRFSEPHVAAAFVRPEAQLRLTNRMDALYSGVVRSWCTARRVQSGDAGSCQRFDPVPHPGERLSGAGPATCTPSTRPAATESRHRTSNAWRFADFGDPLAPDTAQGSGPWIRRPRTMAWR